MITLSKDQEAAVELVLTKKIGIVTGPPGSGKSTIVGTALQLLLEADNRVVLMAPTGKAARRLQEVTGYPAGTIHRTLGAQGGDGNWRWTYNHQNPLPYDVVIVDESSMVDTYLMAALMESVDPNCTRVIFIGDFDQLPSVGAGRVFGDLIESEIVPVAWLTTVHRAAESTWVYRVAPKILRGEWEEAKNDRTYKPIWMSDESRAKERLVDVIANRLPAAGITDFQVMTPMYKGDLGVNSLNAALQDAINPVEFDSGEPEPDFRAKERGFEFRIRARDWVIQQKNDYDRMVFNGETGRVIFVNPESDRVAVDFEDRQVEYSLSEAAEQLRLSYAITVHKFQGSEVKWAVVVCHSAHSSMWNRQLLYTAVTRAREGVVLVGDRAGLQRALEVNDPANRRCGLISLLLEGEVS